MPKNMDEVIRKAKLCYHLFKQRSKLSRNLQHKKMKSWTYVRKDLNPHILGKGQELNTNNNYSIPSSMNSNEINGIRTSSGGWNNNSKEIKFRGCDGPHLYKNFPHNPNRNMAPISML